MNSSPLCKALDRPAVKVGCCYLSGLLVGAASRPGLDGIRELTPMYVLEVDASKPPSGSVSSGPT
jgi:hypothetical protein